MTRERCKQLLPIMQAFADGKTIQYKIGGQWHNDSGSDADVSFLGVTGDEYRIKPERREFWIVSTTTSGYHAFSIESAAYGFAANSRIKPEIIHVREVINE